MSFQNLMFFRHFVTKFFIYFLNDSNINWFAFKIAIKIIIRIPIRIRWLLLSLIWMTRLMQTFNIFFGVENNIFVKVFISILFRSFCLLIKEFRKLLEKPIDISCNFLKRFIIINDLSDCFSWTIGFLSINLFVASSSLWLAITIAIIELLLTVLYFVSYKYFFCFHHYKFIIIEIYGVFKRLTPPNYFFK